MSQTTALARFNELDRLRETKISRCETYAKLTLPYLFPDEAYDENADTVQNSYHSIGAQAVNQLANKMMLALFQPNSTFFRLTLPEETLASLTQQLGLQPGMIEQVFSGKEKEAVEVMATGNYRPQLFEALKHLIIVGNVCPKFDDEGQIELVTLRDYVVQRSRRGDLLEMLVREKKPFSLLDEGAREEYAQAKGAREEHEEVTQVYWIKLNTGGKTYRVTQWIGDHKLSDKFDSQYNVDDLPWKPQTWVLPAGNHYGTSLVEEYYGDLKALDVYADSQTDGAILASLWRFMVNPGGETRPEDLAKSRNGDALPGTEKDISVLTADVRNNLQVISALMQETAQRVGRGFLMMSSVTRDAERVTAQEIRLLANELETGLGGVYTRLASTLQKPMAHFLLRSIDVRIAGTELDATVVTGFEALSRQSELERMTLFLQDVAGVAALPPEVRDWLKEEDIYNFLATGRGLERTKYVRTEQEVQQIQGQRAQQQQAQAIAIEQAKRQQPQGDM